MHLGLSEAAFIEGCPRIKGGLYEGFNCIILLCMNDILVLPISHQMRRRRLERLSNLPLRSQTAPSQTTPTKITPTKPTSQVGSASVPNIVYTDEVGGRERGREEGGRELRGEGGGRELRREGGGGS